MPSHKIADNILYDVGLRRLLFAALAGILMKPQMLPSPWHTPLYLSPQNKDSNGDSSRKTADFVFVSLVASGKTFIAIF